MTGSIEPKEGLAYYLAHLTSQIGSKPVSEEACSLIRQHILDAVAAAFIGCRKETFVNLCNLAPKLEKGSVWPGSGPQRIAPLDAAMVWAFAVNASVFEDGSREGACHPGAVVMPIIIALSTGGSWEQIDRATMAGYDVMVRMARGGNPAFTAKGFHPTSITAPFGAAAAASLLLGHDLLKTEHALSLAAMGSSGLMSSFRAGDSQPLQVAWAVRCGLAAALMAGEGQAGYPRIIEEGFYPAYLGHAPDPPLDHPLEQEYAIFGSYLKPYPGCRHLHPSIDAFSKILDGNQVRPEKIEKVHVGTYKAAVVTEIHTLNSRGDAYFNIPYALGAKALLGKNDYDAFSERHFKNARLLALMKKVRVDVDPDVDKRYPKQRGATVEVLTQDGKTYRSKVSCPLGEPENPLPLSVTLEKFRVAAGNYLSKENMERIEGLLNVSDPSEPAERLFEALSGREI
jgi:2-methylcitrate dehydratase PrpD